MLTTLPSIRERFFAEGILAALAANSGWLLFDKAVRIVLGLVVGSLVARHLGPSDYGQLSYVVAYVAVFMAAANMGGDGITVRDLVREPGAAGVLLGSASVARAIAGIACLAAAVLSMFFLHDRGSDLALMTALVGASLVLQAVDTIDLWFQSRLQSRRTVVSKLVAYVLSSVIKLALICTAAPVTAFAAVLALDALLSAVALGVAYRAFPANGGWAVTRLRVLTFLREVWPFLLGGLLVVAYMRADQLAVGRLLGDKSLGLYAGSVWLLQVWYVLPMTLATSLGPYLANQKARDELAYRRIVVLASRVFFYIGLLAAGLTTIVAPYVVPWVLGSEYAAAASLLQVYSLTMPLYFLSLAHNLWLVNEGRYMVRVHGALVGVVILVGLIYLLAPLMGVMSAPVAALISQLVSFFLINFWLDRAAFDLQFRAITFT